MSQPLTPQQAKHFVLLALDGNGGEVVFHSHALRRMRERKIAQQSVYETLRMGWVYLPAEEVRGQWRYQFQHKRQGSAVVVEIWAEAEILVVTVW